MLDNPFESKIEMDTLKPTLYFSKLDELRNKKQKRPIEYNKRQAR